MAFLSRLNAWLPRAGSYPLVTFFLLVYAGACLGQDGLAVRDTVDGTVGVRQQTQMQEDAWASEKNALIRRFRAATAKNSWLGERVEIQSQRTGAVAGRVVELQRRLNEATRLEDSLQDTLQVILKRLEDSVATSLPFLPEERSFRLQTLRDDMARLDLGSAEKLRRLLEALQVETGYGSTVEVYQDQILVAGQGLNVDILRLGRVALFWMTPDRKQGGVYDQGVAAWVSLAGGARRRIALAMDMATRVRPVDLLALPVGRISPQQEVAP